MCHVASQLPVSGPVIPCTPISLPDARGSAPVPAQMLDESSSSSEEEDDEPSSDCFESDDSDAKGRGKKKGAASKRGGAASGKVRREGSGALGGV